MKKVFALAPSEDWIVDRWVKEWYEYNPDMSVARPEESDVIWLLADWCWNQIDTSLLSQKKVVATVHHVTPGKFGKNELNEFLFRDKFVDVYHVPCEKTREQIKNLTDKPVIKILPWVNQNIWYQDDNAGKELRKKLNISDETYLVGSFQRDTEGKDLVTPKLEKGPDRFCDIVISMSKTSVRPVEVLLGGWRRQYVMNRLSREGIKYHYIERSSFKTVNDMYNAIDLYIVAARYEGGPQSIVECALTRTPIISTDVGFASEILHPVSIFDGTVASFNLAKVDVDHPRQVIEKQMIPNGFIPFKELFLGM